MAKHSREGNVYYGEFGKEEHQPPHPLEKKGVVYRDFSKPKPNPKETMETGGSLEVLNDFELGFMPKFWGLIKDTAKGSIDLGKLAGEIAGQGMALGELLNDEILDLSENQGLRGRIKKYREIINSFLVAQLHPANKNNKNIVRGEEAFEQLYRELNGVRVGKSKET